MTLIHSLTNADFFPHPCQQIEVIETHISWLLLTGDIAYKIKKPVDFGFLDFTSLEKRKHFCEEELRLNQRLAPDIYLEVIPISGTTETPLVGSDEAPLEYAVKMTQFDPARRLDLLLQAKRFEESWIDTLAEQIADFHDRIPRVAADSAWGEPDTIWGVMWDNFLHLEQTVSDEAARDTLQHLAAHTTAQFDELRELIIQRKRDGKVRECHGDLHLANITLFNDELRLFDCIEFNLQFRWIDTISDLAFLLMDLEANDQFRWANRCLNRYLELSGDYESLRLLNLYKSYRSMVRAKVAMLGEAPDHATLQRYLALTSRYAEPQQPTIYLMHGVSGSGKSYLSQQMIDATGAIRIRSDVERKRIYRELSLKGEQLDLYGREMNARTYNRLCEIARILLHSGYSVVMDATFIRQRARQSYFDLSQEFGLPIRIISCECEQKLIEARLRRRLNEGTDASDADVGIMHQQLGHLQPLTEDELDYTIRINTDDDEAVLHLTNRLQQEQLID
ncbi:bifunctional aminoglycoside phosphotransferase/ATP-binding protein [Marinobacterium jannaschii]|uniref:bifunctional aminoglycoside phosphotransferase/ATP-binding protein n=1 Tax=Marinobacterium jannaschii TaxID=64970 RepID=UPI00047F4B3B|nr:bifunctional aminoglycoside phosphotransferase/ATP-binding protein [Marinobacterium jannaschii]